MVRGNRAEVIAQWKCGENLEDRPVQIEFSFVPQLHCNQADKGFANRADPEWLVRSDWLAAFDIAVPVRRDPMIVAFGAGQNHARSEHRAHVIMVVAV